MNPYSEIQARLGLSQPLPFTPEWSAAPDFIDLIVDHALQTKPEVIVECSSGLTTLVLARCCQINGRGGVISLENGEEYAEKTRQQLETFALDDYAQVLYSPLEKVALDQDYDWYSLESLPEVSIDMLVIDGPPGFIQKNSRYPALPLLFEKFSKKCSVFLDDAARDDEKELVAQWQAEFSGIEHEYLEFERGCSVL
ncbi:MAG: class I SAM-dependent methyltransferase, partial [Gammaproteobacteria bacterium]|nr:class I SAM-dependent methyltransferase [Gammaproteobacteria bacterium]